MPATSVGGAHEPLTCVFLRGACARGAGESCGVFVGAGVALGLVVRVGRGNGATDSSVARGVGVTDGVGDSEVEGVGRGDSTAEGVADGVGRTASGSGASDCAGAAEGSTTGVTRSPPAA